MLSLGLWLAATLPIGFASSGNSGIGANNLIFTFIISSTAVTIFWIKGLERKPNSGWLILIIFICDYIISVLSVMVFQWVITARLATMAESIETASLSIENIDEYNRLFNINVNDLGRNLFPFFSIIYSIIVAFLWFFLLQCAVFFGRKLKNKGHE